MFRTPYIRTLILAAAAFAAACTADPVFNEEGDGLAHEDAEPASLTIDFSIADLGIDVSSRAETGTNPGTTPTFALSGALPAEVVKYLNPDPNTWTAPDENASPAERRAYYEARSINGSLMTCLTVILVHRHSNKIVGVRRIPDPDCPNKEVQIDPNNPKQQDPDNAIYNGNELGEVLRDEHGNIVLDSDGTIRSVVGTRARITFDYENPVHVVTQEIVDALVAAAGTEEEKAAIRAANEPYIGQSAEKLTRGEYSILAIANYDHNVTTSADDGEPTLNVDKTLENIANRFHQPQYMAEGVPNFNPGYKFLYDLRFLMNRTLKSDGNGGLDVVNITGEDGKQILPYIRPAVHQTLTAAKDIYLTAGKNQLDIELLRISSRTRVEVKNYGDIPLKVHSLKFSDNYTQSSNYLFRRNKNNRDFSELANKATYNDHDGKGAPMVEYTGILHPGSDPTYGAIVPFIKDWDSDDDNVVDGVKVKPGNKRCIFDALMYESSVDYKDEDSDLDSFTYTIDVSYPSVNNYKTTDIKKIDKEKWEKDGRLMEPDLDRATFKYATTDESKDYIHNPTSAEAVYNSIQSIEEGLASYHGSCYFLIQGVSSNKYLYEKEDGTLYAYQDGDVSLDKKDLDVKSFLWRLDGLEKDADGNYYCYLKNLRSGKHMPAIPQCVTPTDEDHTMSTDDTTVPKYQLGVSDLDNSGNHSGVYNVMFSNYFDPPYSYSGSQYSYSYLSVWGVGEKYLSGWHTADRGCQYRLYPVAMIPQMLYVGTPRVTKTVELTAFSDETGYVEKVREIQRNDFMRILVEVSYNTKEGDFEFEVKQWDERTGSVEFH